MSLGNVAIIGGGRWARVLAGVALGVVPFRSRLALCSPSAPAGWAQWLVDQPAEKRARCDQYDSLENVLRDASISHMVIARAAKDHADTAHLALDAGKIVFLEKPFATDLPAAQALVNRLGTSSKSSMTGLVFRYAENLRRFATACAERGDATHIALTWGDAADEMRHGERKNHDASLNVAWDVFPHVWSILRQLVPNGTISLSDTNWIDDGHGIVAIFEIGSTRVNVTMTRSAKARTRRVLIEGTDWKGQVDFASEPGQAWIDGVPVDVATGFSSPLSRELSAFFGVGDDPIDPLCLLPNALEAIAIASEISERLRTAPR